MSRRIYYPSSRRRKIQQEALAVMRRTRKSIDPRVLDIARKAIGEALAQREQEQPELNDNQSHVRLDHRKNLITIKRYLELCPDNARLLDKIKALLNQ